MSLINGTSTSAFLYCTSPPATQTFYTTIYETVLPAACETSQWMATYTITETCAGNPADYVTAVVPPGFVVTTVSCPSCNPNEIEITCPGAQPTGMGKPTVAIGGNGVTATITATPIAATPIAATPIRAPGMGSAPAAATGAPAPVVTAIVNQAGITGSAGSSGSCGSSGCVGVIGSNGNNGNNGSMVSGGNNGATGSGSSSGSGNMGGSSGSSASNSTTGMTGTAGTPPVSFTGAASSPTRNLALVSALALVAGHFFFL
ncbi:hypothetical protein F4809DRAFT_256556 [Biscogniauxia mediterranea]|nr:hypothetical protein F4809DRAFT_256556 [Biscogniauxia mediterranea]